MKKVKFGEYIDRIDGNEDRLTTDLEYYVGGEHYDSESIIIDRFGLIKEKDLGYQFHYPFKKGDVLFMTKNPYLKKCGMVTFDGICSIASFVLRTKNEDVLLQEFIPLICQTDDFWNYLEKNKSGSVNYFITWKTLSAYEFCLPDLNTQRTNIEITYAAYNMKESYKNLLNKTEELIKARFVEMFGDITDTVLVEDCCTLHARIGWQALTKNEHQQTGEYMLITGTDFKEGKIDFSGCVYVSKDRYDMDPNIQVRNNDILITKDGTIGKVAVVEGLTMPATLNAGVFVLRPDERFVKEYIAYVFKGPLFSEFVENAKTGSTIKHLNQGKLVKFEIPVPSVEKQNAFAEFYKQIDKSKFVLQESFNTANNMLKALINNVFNLQEEE